MAEQHIEGYHVEIIPPKQDSQKLEEDLELFASKLTRIRGSGFTASITDNAMGLLAFQGHECIEELGIDIDPDKILIHLNTFHTKQNLEELNKCKGFVRSSLAKKIDIRKTPEITFYLDETYEKAKRLDEVLQKESNQIENMKSNKKDA